MAEPIAKFMSQETTVNLANCDREPIHIPGSIQPHAILMVLTEPDLVVQQITNNVAFAISGGAASCLNRPLSELVESRDLDYLRRKVLPRELDEAPHYLPGMRFMGHATEFEAIVHRYQGALILELEHWPHEETAVHEEIYGSLKATLSQLDRMPTLESFCQKAAEQVKEFTGFDRVMVYRFAEDDSGHVIAEARRSDLESYLGLHYPAADIPRQARELFKRSQLRLNPDVRYQPVPLVPALRPDTHQPLDMSFCITRSMSPIHAEYLQNMGVHASMSISIVVNDRLWGLFACHHYSPRYVSHGTRMACEFLAHTLSLQVAGKEAADQHTYAEALHREHHALVAELNSAPSLPEALRCPPEGMIGGIQATGAALLFNHQVQLYGITPDEASIRKLAARLGNEVEEAVWSTDRLGERFPDLAESCAAASGTLSVRLSKQAEAYLFWFRQEETQTVNWAGEPAKAVTLGPHGDRLTPRKSFALWQETVKGRSRPWLTCEYDAARQLRQSILEHFVRHTEQLVRLNADLQERNSQLDSFAYVASHDLKEPLRGIRNYAQFLMEDFGDDLAEEAKGYTRTVMRLADRMEMLLDSLLHYSRLSRQEIQNTAVDLNECVADALEFLISRVQESGLRITIPRPLPIVQGDSDRLCELFTNLISNAIKYNDKPVPEVLVTFETSADGTTCEVQVRDNGIGIAPEHRNIVFQIFKRLHGRNEYGGGIGAGLTIVRKIVERHGGNIWIDSVSGVSTTFSFTLPVASPHAP